MSPMQLLIRLAMWQAMWGITRSVSDGSCDNGVPSWNANSQPRPTPISWADNIRKRKPAWAVNRDGGYVRRSNVWYLTKPLSRTCRAYFHGLCLHFLDHENSHEAAFCLEAQHWRKVWGISISRGLFVTSNDRALTHPSFLMTLFTIAGPVFTWPRNWEWDIIDSPPPPPAPLPTPPLSSDGTRPWRGWPQCPPAVPCPLTLSTWPLPTPLTNEGPPFTLALRTVY